MSRAHSLLHDRVAERITHGVALTVKLERSAGVGGTGQLERPNVRQVLISLAHIAESENSAVHCAMHCATHHDDALLIQQDGVDGLLGLDIHHGLIVLLGIFRVDGGRHCIWSI